MKTIRRLFYGEVLMAVALVTLGFVTLFAFFDLVGELQAVTRNGAGGYRIPQAALYVLLMVPSHVYELLPITVLIGTIFVMARFAQSSEFTILRTSGLGPWRALRTLLLLGLGFVLLTFAVGDYLAPLSDRTAQLLKSQLHGGISVGKTGAWLKEKQPYGNYAVNVGALSPEGEMQNLRIFEFDNQGRLVSVLHSARAHFGEHDDWLLEDVQRNEFLPTAPSAAGTNGSASTSANTNVNTNGSSRVGRMQSASFRWPTSITAEMVSAAVLRPERMGTVDLFQYMRHLNSNGQSAQKYEIQFWKKVFYPLSCLVMVVLALPFAYLHFRAGGIASYVFGGVMAGISFVLLNNLLGDLGALQGWQPWVTAALPGIIYSLLSLTAFTWLVIRR